MDNFNPEFLALLGFCYRNILNMTSQCTCVDTTSVSSMKRVQFSFDEERAHSDNLVFVIFDDDGKIGIISTM